MKIFGKIILYATLIFGGLFLLQVIVDPNTPKAITQDYAKETNQVRVQYANPAQWEKEQRDHWKFQLNNLKLLYQEEYNATKDAVEVLSANNSLLFGNPSLSSVEREMQLQGVMLTNLSAMADCILMGAYQIMTEPLAEGKTRYEVLKYRLLVKSNYIPGGNDYSKGFVKDGNNESAEPLYDDWLYNLSCIALSEEDAREMVEEASYDGKVSYDYLNKHASALEAKDERLPELRQLLRMYYDSVEEPSITYNEFEVWACCFFLYDKDFDFKTVKKIIADKTIIGNVKLKPNTGSPIIL